MGSFFGFIVMMMILGGSIAASGVRIVNQSDEALVETLGKYTGKKLSPGLNFVVPFLDRVVFKQTIRERVLDIPPQQCITRDNVSISVDAVVYWRIVDLEKAYYKVENLQSAMVNLVLTQVRAEMGKLELDETFTARSEINEILLRERDKIPLDGRSLYQRDKINLGFGGFIFADHQFKYWEIIHLFYFQT